MPHFGMPEIRMPKFFGGSSSGSSNGVGNTSDKGTKEPQSTGIDKLYPDDCGRDDKNKGLLCFPDGELCKNRKQGKSSLYFILPVSPFLIINFIQFHNIFLLNGTLSMWRNIGAIGALFLGQFYHFKTTHSLYSTTTQTQNQCFVDLKSCISTKSI